MKIYNIQLKDHEGVIKDIFSVGIDNDRLIISSWTGKLGLKPYVVEQQNYTAETAQLKGEVK